MKSALVSDTTKSAKTLAQTIAKQIAREPGEILKNAENQVTGQETLETRENPSVNQNPEDRAKLSQHQKELQDKMKSSRRMEAFQKELDDIRKQNLFKDLQEKIAQGVVVPLEDYSELSMEQKQVLKAQMEAVRGQISAQKAAAGKTLEIPRSKKGRRFGQTRKEEAQREQTRVEKPIPPSGKFQIRISKSQTNTKFKIQNSKRLEFRISCFEIYLLQ